MCETLFEMNIRHVYFILLAWLWRRTESLKHDQQTVIRTNHPVAHDSNVSSRSELKTLQSGIHQRHLNLHSLQHASEIVNQTVDVTVPVGEAPSNDNVTVYEIQLRQLWSLQKLKIQGQYAYISIVFLICLTLAGLQCMGGLRGRYSKTASVSVNEDVHFLTIKELLIIKASYLPILHRNNELKEVLVHDCGNDP